MHCYILIRKASYKNKTHYYAVYKKDNEYEISYYVGLEADKAKIVFFENQSFERPFAIYDLKTDGFEKLDSSLKSLIDGRVIMKGLKAIHNNEFAESISWEG